MSPTAAVAATGRYLISARGDDTALTNFIEQAHNDPSLKLVDIIGPPGHPHTAVVEMSPQTAAGLEQRFRSTQQLTIEPDRPLSLSE